MFGRVPSCRTTAPAGVIQCGPAPARYPLSCYTGCCRSVSIELGFIALVFALVQMQQYSVLSIILVLGTCHTFNHLLLPLLPISAASAVSPQSMASSRWCSPVCMKQYKLLSSSLDHSTCHALTLVLHLLLPSFLVRAWLHHSGAAFMLDEAV